MYGLTFELPRRRWCDATGAVLLSVTAVRSLVDFRQHKDITLSEHVRSNVECDVCKAYIYIRNENIHVFSIYHTISTWIDSFCMLLDSHTYTLGKNAHLMEIYIHKHIYSHCTVYKGIYGECTKGNLQSPYYMNGSCMIVILKKNPTHLSYMHIFYELKALCIVYTAYLFISFCVFAAFCTFHSCSSRGRYGRKSNLLHKFFRVHFFCFNNAVQLNENEYCAVHYNWVQWMSRSWANRWIDSVYLYVCVTWYDTKWNIWNRYSPDSWDLR